MRTLLDTVVRSRVRSTSTQPRHFSLIDFGADTVKAVVVRREKRGVRVLGYGFAAAEGRGLSSRRADVAALAATAEEALVAAEDSTADNGQGKVVPDEAIFCLPARLTRGECFSVQQTRPDPATPITARELKSAWERVERLSRERLALPGEDQTAWKPLAIAPCIPVVDGHHVTDPVGLKGREISISAFGVAVLPSALRAAEGVAERLDLRLINTVAAPQALASIAPQRDAILIDVGVQGTSLHLIHHDALVSTCWWAQGGEFFTESMAWTFRCSSQEAEALKRAYAHQALSAQDSALVARSLADPVAIWMEGLVARLRQMSAAEANHRPAHTPMSSNGTEALPGRIYLSGGGSLLPDLSQALRSLEMATSLSFRRSLEIEPLGLRLGVRARGRPPLLDVPPHPACDLLASAISLATCLT